MLNQPTLTELIINFFSNIDDVLDAMPRSMTQLIYWDQHQYYKYKERLKSEEKRERKRIKECLLRLKSAQILTYHNNINQYKLTADGWLKYLYYKSRQKIKKKKIGDKQLKYVIVFDIPERYKRFRDLFRKCLKNLGFELIQKSTFLGTSETDFKWAQKIVANCQLDGYVKFIEVKKIY